MEFVKVKSASKYCLKMIAQTQAKICGILRDHYGKPGSTHYPDLEPDNEF